MSLEHEWKNTFRIVTNISYFKKITFGVGYFSALLFPVAGIICKVASPSPVLWVVYFPSSRANFHSLFSTLNIILVIVIMKDITHDVTSACQPLIAQGAFLWVIECGLCIESRPTALTLSLREISSLPRGRPFFCANSRSRQEKIIQLPASPFHQTYKTPTVAPSPITAFILRILNVGRRKEICQNGECWVLQLILKKINNYILDKQWEK